MRARPMLQSIFRKVYDLLAKTFLHRIPGMWRISNLLFRVVWRDIHIIEVEGSKMWVNFNEPDPALRKTFQVYGLNLIHEEATTALFKKVVEPGNVVLDLGANIGYFTLLAAKLVGEAGQVYAFEPEPRNFFYLKKNLDINAYTNVIAEEKAVSDRNGKTKLFICSYDSGHHTINQEDGIEAYSRGRRFERKYIEIDVVALDEFLKGREERVDVVKIDVEGAEALAVSGMENILKSNKNIKVFLEFFPILMEKMDSSPQGFIESLLEDFGFTIHAIGHDYSMENYGPASLIRIDGYQELKGLLKDEFDHINIYLTRIGGVS